MTRAREKWGAKETAKVKGPEALAKAKEIKAS